MNATGLTRLLFIDALTSKLYFDFVAEISEVEQIPAVVYNLLMVCFKFCYSNLQYN